MRRILTLALVLGGCLAAGQCSAGEKKPAPTPTTMARDIVTSFSKDDYAGVGKHFDGTMKKALPPAKLKEVWQQLQAQAGKFKDQGAVRTGKLQGHDVVYVVTRFEKVELECKVIFDDQKRVVGLFFVQKGSS